MGNTFEEAARGKGKIALERIKILFELAEKEFRNNPGRSNRYVELARKISMRYNVRIPKELKRRFCKKCHHYIVPGKNARIRTNGKSRSLILTCMDCGNVYRYGYGLKTK